MRRSQAHRVPAVARRRVAHCSGHLVCPCSIEAGLYQELGPRLQRDSLAAGGSDLAHSERMARRDFIISSLHHLPADFALGLEPKDDAEPASSPTRHHHRPGLFDVNGLLQEALTVCTPAPAPAGRPSGWCEPWPTWTRT